MHVCMHCLFFSRTQLDLIIDSAEGWLFANDTYMLAQYEYLYMEGRFFFFLWHTVDISKSNFKYSRDEDQN